MAPITVEKLIHVNQLLGDFARANAFYRDVFGAQEYMNSYHEGEERDASLFLVGDTCIELFSPRTATSLLGRQLARFGDSWHSFEWKVSDLEEAKAALDARGVRLGSYYPGSFLMTHPRDTHGMIIELCPHEMANDPRLEPGWSPEPWRDRHPLGIERLNHLSCAVRDLPGAVTFVTELTGAEHLYEVDRPAIGGRAAGLWLTDHVLELVEPTTGDGAVAAYLEQMGPRLRSIQFRVVDLARARRHLEEMGLRTVPGDTASAFGIDPRDNFGVLWQFTEEPLPGDPR
ncbi:MAG TPA: VOC family protein [Acidimicrobiales bacterium]|nr:VOC family protein [Acidimicrobiales bacterium]